MFLIMSFYVLSNLSIGGVDHLFHAISENSISYMQASRFVQFRCSITVVVIIIRLIRQMIYLLPHRRLHEAVRPFM